MGIRTYWALTHVHPGMGKLKSFRIRNPRLHHILYGLYAQVREKIIQGLDPWAPMGWAYGAVFWQEYGRTAHVK